MEMEIENENDDIPQIKINEEYARRYEHNKKREDLQRYEELKKRGLVADPSRQSDSDSESSSSEDEDDILLANSKKKDLEFLEALIKVKNRDPSLKNKDVELFKSDGTEKTRAKGKGNGKAKKKMYLKDVVAKHLIEDGPELKEDDITPSAVAEEEEDDNGELLVEKDKNAVGDDDDDDSVVNAEYDQKLNECFPDEDENARFLRDFIKFQQWKEDKQSKGSGPG
ncbi:protein kri1 [Prunus yedoensis var. nudiflora]|uniref:Protein kri1 n=1 Tax=Prunus yedoensis var. nudiflora TaxID=2094558 RepID=A0A314YVX6_PRUYE|nr:protein kri1 [Prunus yedoensis var. nudiflora]